MSNTTILTATKSDVFLFLPLVRAYWNFEGIYPFRSTLVTKQLKRLFSEPNLGNGWLALKENNAIGYLIAVYVFSLENLGITAEIDEFFVLPQYRKQGIGNKLMTTAEGEFMRNGCTNISLQVSKNNEAAKAFYYRHGYSERTRYDLLEKELPSI